MQGTTTLQMVIPFLIGTIRYSLKVLFFLPASGGRLEKKVSGVGKGGEYWSFSQSGDKVCYLYVRSESLNAQGICGKANGFSVRLVCAAN